MPTTYSQLTHKQFTASFRSVPLDQAAAITAWNLKFRQPNVTEALHQMNLQFALIQASLIGLKTETGTFKLEFGGDGADIEITHAALYDIWKRDSDLFHVMSMHVQNQITQDLAFSRNSSGTH